MWVDVAADTPGQSLRLSSPQKLPILLKAQLLE